MGSGFSFSPNAPVPGLTPLGGIFLWCGEGAKIARLDKVTVMWYTRLRSQGRGSARRRATREKKNDCEQRYGVA